MSRDIIKLDQIDVTFHQKKRTITAVNPNYSPQI